LRLGQQAALVIVAYGPHGDACERGHITDGQ
jgi:hypothetical protein